MSYCRIVLLLISLAVLSGCGSRGYHEYALTHSMNSSAQKEHLEALQRGSSNGLDHNAQVCVYYQKGLGSFSSGCGMLTFSPYVVASR